MIIDWLMLSSGKLFTLLFFARKQFVDKTKFVSIF